MTTTQSAVVARVSAAGLAKHVKIGRPGTMPADQEGRGGVTYRELARRIRDALLDGRLAVHTQLPSERALADALQLSRTTVTAAYALLRQEGWLASRRGSGSVLQPAPGVPNGSWASMWPPSGDDAPINLTTASLPAPADHVELAVRAAVDDLGRYFGHDGYEPLGIPALRESIAQRYTAEGLPTTPEEILVTNGGQHAWTIVLTELSGPGDRVLLECPTYPLALEAVRSGRRIPVPVGLRPAASQPWDLELMTSAMVQSAPRLAYLIPDFHNPTGAVMSAAARSELIGSATRTATVLVVDETLRDVGFDDTRPVPAHAASFDRARRVITIGSMSKSFWGGLRIGWLRANRSLVERLAAVRSLQDMAGSVLDQLVANRLLTEHPGALDVQRARLRAGSRALHDALAEELPHWRPTHPSGGASLWVELPGPYATELARLAPAAGVAIVPGPRFGPDGTMESYLRLPFTMPPDALRVAVHRLAGIDAEAAAARPALPQRWMT